MYVYGHSIAYTDRESLVPLFESAQVKQINIFCMNDSDVESKKENSNKMFGLNNDIHKKTIFKMIHDI